MFILTLLTLPYNNKHTATQLTNFSKTATTARSMPATAHTDSQQPTTPRNAKKPKQTCNTQNKTHTPAQPPSQKHQRSCTYQPDHRSKPTPYRQQYAIASDTPPNTLKQARNTHVDVSPKQAPKQQIPAHTAPTQKTAKNRRTATKTPHFCNIPVTQMLHNRYISGTMTRSQVGPLD